MVHLATKWGGFFHFPIKRRLPGIQMVSVPSLWGLFPTCPMKGQSSRSMKLLLWGTDTVCPLNHHPTQFPRGWRENWTCAPAASFPCFFPSAPGTWLMFTPSPLCDLVLAPWMSSLPVLGWTVISKQRQVGVLMSSTSEGDLIYPEGHCRCLELRWSHMTGVLIRRHSCENRDR